MPVSARIIRIATATSVAALAALAAIGCGSDSDPPAECGDVRQLPRVINGTEMPTHVPLTTGQILAIGDFNGCSGTLIAPTWVLTATHCGLTTLARFCMGEQPGSADLCIGAARIENHPELDLTLMELVDDARNVLPAVEPIPIMTEIIDDAWVGRTAEAAGYGQTEAGSLGTRYFTAEPIVSVSTAFVTVDGNGQRGLCFGDSGGPVMVIASDNTVRVAGALSTGDTSCRGRDNFTRTDRLQEYIESFTGPTQVDGGGCGLIDGVGRCNGGIAMWCEDAALVTEDCSASACGWDTGQGAFRCIQGNDPCLGFDRRGGCDGDVARWCEDGEPRSAACDSCGSLCDAFATSEGAYCVIDECMGLDYLGRCNGNVAEWCDGGQLLSRDCSETDMTCGYIDDETGYFCQ